MRTKFLIKYENYRTKLNKTLTPVRVILLGFLIGALIGSGLLSLDITHRKGVEIEYIDALFVSVSSICVTGLSTVNIGETFNGFGQVILMILIQVGGLGIVTFTTLLLMLLRQRISLDTRILIQNAYNLDTLTGLVKMVKKIVIATLVIEGIGALGYMFVFVPKYHLVGVWYSVFHSVSAFCNAGIDLLGGNSFCEYSGDVILNITTMFLIIMGGLGFPVYWEIIRDLKENRYGKRRIFKSLNVHSKIVISTTIGLLVLGAVVTLIFEYNNSASIGDKPLPEKILSSFFQSTTLRTAGFATIDQSGFRTSTCLFYMILMFIGGSPAGTAGGVKTVTVALLFLSMMSDIKGETGIVSHKRKIAAEYVRRSVAIVTLSFTVLMVLTILIMNVQGEAFVDILYEMVSAIATVGLSRGLTGSLCEIGKVIVMLAMYLGRVGPISLALAFNTKNKSTSKSYAEAKVMVG